MIFYDETTNIFHKWLENFDIKQCYGLFNSLDEDLKFMFENPSRTLNFLDIQLKIVDKTLVFDIYYKPSNSFRYLTCSTCHPSQTKNDIAFSLAKRIKSIVTDNRKKRLSILKKEITHLKQLIIDLLNAFSQIRQKQKFRENNFYKDI